MAHYQRELNSTSRKKRKYILHEVIRRATQRQVLKYHQEQQSSMDNDKTTIVEQQPQNPIGTRVRRNFGKRMDPGEENSYDAHKNTTGLNIITEILKK